MKNLNDTELKDVVGGNGWDFYTQSDRVKMVDGTVCKCGHAVGTLQPRIGHALLVCEKCGNPIAMISNQLFVERV